MQLYGLQWRKLFIIFILSFRMMHLEMDNTTLDLLILTQIHSHIHKGQVKTRRKSQIGHKRDLLDYF